MKTPVIKKKDYTVYFENHEGYTFVHCDCYKWSKEVKQCLINDFDSLVSIHGEPIYALHDKEDRKHWKFITMFKFSLKTDILCTDGVIRQVFERKA